MDASSRSAVAARPPPKETYRRAGRGDPSAGSAVREPATTARSTSGGAVLGRGRPQRDRRPRQISVDVEDHPSPVTCAVVAGADLNAFHVGDEVTMKCKLIGEGFKLKLLESATAHYELNG
jgi:hypothetical protein